MRKQISHSKRALRFLVLAFVLASAGCAVLTVDVDMYKGPLGNEETVIAEQIKAEIIGAKSLLLTLRNTLEKTEKGSESYLKEQEFMPMPYDEEERKAKWLKHPDAIRVNAILGLYEDRPPGVRDKVTRAYLDKLKDNFDRFRNIQTVMNPNAKDDRLFWEKYTKHLYSAKDHPVIKILRKNIDEIKEPNTLKSLEKGLELMQLGYRELLYPDHPNNPGRRPYRYIMSIADAHNNINKLVDVLDITAKNGGIKGLNLNAIRKSLKKIKEGGDAPKATNDKFVWLLDEDLVRAHVDFLFKNSLDKTQREDFIERVNLIARNFIERLSVMDESLRDTLELIEHINSREAEHIENAPLLTNVTIKLALSLIKIKSLHAAVSNKHAPDDTIALREKLWGILPEEAKPKDRRWDRQRIEKYQDALLLLFKENPRTVSSQLYNTHLFFIVGPYDDRSGEKENNKYKEAARRRFGIVLTMPEEVGIDVLIDNFKGVARFQTGAGLDRGRLPEGLEKLIDDYLVLARDQSAGPTDKEQEMLDKKRDVLIEALIRFAEKGLVIANYDTLLRSNRGLDKKEEEQIKQYTDVLQAIGNSIIVMANELKMKASYEQKLEDDQHRENKAMTKVFSSGINCTSAGISCHSKTSKDVLDEMIALLRYEHIRKIKKFGKDSNQAKWVAEALDVLYKQRADMVYIRPASAYLRSSYPAASLQRDPSVAGWKNMLGGHAWRSVPFFGEKAGNKSKSDLETLYDIDKQSWQNINHIRVAGTGDTSYVIVKDDIGNWYIKGYKGDPEPIIKGAKNMALFAASAQAGRNLVDVPESSKSKEPLPEPPQARQLREYNARYQKQLEQDYNELKEVVEGLPKRIASLWDAFIPDTNASKEELKNKVLKGPEDKLSKTVNEVSKRNEKDRNYMEMYMDMLSAVLEYHNDIKLRLGDPKDYQADREKVVKIARKSITNALSEVLNRFIERRETESGKHETALMIIGDTGE
ncbi:MAG: hypothetical protein GWN67_12290 [Phycisphaerae bacterium]|nr:hypothetical protein [Phycisphaerae bacterium]NIR67179.1 hypothetical protein [candidate division Zixibacteria bacterium]NIP53633.1 hypothetical protein [Phycisphaerae bacterium]NIS51903.1 hypothetical protein [Phycisphaerae bacterium]NIU09414.1 hypothetical protein [Phycisphaerae bacterium]